MYLPRPVRDSVGWACLPSKGGREKALNNSEIHTKRCKCAMQGIGLNIFWEERMRRIGSKHHHSDLSWNIGEWPKICAKNAIIFINYLIHGFQVNFMIFHGSWLAFMVFQSSMVVLEVISCFFNIVWCFFTVVGWISWSFKVILWVLR